MGNGASIKFGINSWVSRLSQFKSIELKSVGWHETCGIFYQPWKGHLGYGKTTKYLIINKGEQNFIDFAGRISLARHKKVVLHRNMHLFSKVEILCSKTEPRSG